MYIPNPAIEHLYFIRFPYATHTHIYMNKKSCINFCNNIPKPNTSQLYQTHTHTESKSTQFQQFKWIISNTQHRHTHTYVTKSTKVKKNTFGNQLNSQNTILNRIQLYQHIHNKINTTVYISKPAKKQLNLKQYIYTYTHT